MEGKGNPLRTRSDLDICASTLPLAPKVCSAGPPQHPFLGRAAPSCLSLPVCSSCPQGLRPTGRAAPCGHVTLRTSLQQQPRCPPCLSQGPWHGALPAGLLASGSGPHWLPGWLCHDRAHSEQPEPQHQGWGGGTRPLCLAAVPSPRQPSVLCQWSPTTGGS